MTMAAPVLATRFNARKSAGPRTPQGKAVVAEDFANTCVLDRLLREWRIEHCLHRTMGELRNQRLWEKELVTKERGVVRSTGILPVPRGRLKAGLLSSSFALFEGVFYPCHREVCYPLGPCGAGMATRKPPTPPLSRPG
jgi:hypothetical protein